MFDVFTVKGAKKPRRLGATTVRFKMAAKSEANCKASSSKEQVVVSSVGTTGSVSVQLHPLVIMNISDHHTRIKAQRDGASVQGKTT